MNRITQTFAVLQSNHKKALIPFITAGDPNPSLTVELMHSLVKAGSDIIELGVPFSDPMADGPTIQRSSERALKHHVGLHNVLNMVSEFRKENMQTPVVLMGYANPVEAMGYEYFAAQAEKAGVDGVLTVDYPPEECEDWVRCLEKHGLDAIFLLSPTSKQSRIAQVAKLAKGYIYYVSLKGVTGASNLDLENVASKLAELRAVVSIPIGVGFGIRDAEMASAVAKLADAVVVGSRIIEEIERSSQNELLNNVTHLVASMREAIDEQRN
ncbi:tryptophan synthase subunit alpha [Nitrosomonas sp.]|uniref:tryptophan synthase subunit alpha n=1 Tax=Nitrosomonas sp. TaxID=42353 RepID=UPI001D61D321|nr:tryptophan synthase subunit alpha [Nitrosomonas sp.]MCB1949197.1 tryptophan synthase subunit alpha [Nitrosomonas sp.]MCP5242652.1 tryptophan synthase subunit alpha [Burkholderiales bacterium]MDR4513345.1 tryptophan synthase subunit alpha [Nitrosomonas sp.]